MTTHNEDAMYEYVLVLSDAERRESDHCLVRHAEHLQQLVGGPLNDVVKFQRWILKCYTDTNDGHHEFLEYTLARHYEEDIFDVLDGDPTIKFTTTYDTVGLLRRPVPSIG